MGRVCLGIMGWAMVWSAVWLGALEQVARGADEDDTKGSLVIIGGVIRSSESAIWSRLIDLAGGPGAKIAVFPTASGDPIPTGNRSVDALKRYGAEAFLVPVALSKIGVDYRQVVADPNWVERVRGASGVFFVGGAQANITRALRSADGNNTPILDAVWQVYRRGGVVAGYSAGAAIMSSVMCKEAGMVLRTLRHGVTLGKEVDQGFGFLNHDWFVEQHCLTRGRFARALAIMDAQGVDYGIGVDDNTALVVERNTELEVIGQRGVVMLDMSEARHDSLIRGFNLHNVKLSYLDHGDRLNLRTLEVTPANHKLRGTKIDPQAPGFDPDYDEDQFESNILGDTTLANLMTTLIDNRQPQAVGLAFDGSEARKGPTAGFEFRFYREPDSVGWFSDAEGDDAYTVLNIHLDIRPVEVGGPLYQTRARDLEASGR